MVKTIEESKSYWKKYYEKNKNERKCYKNKNREKISNTSKIYYKKNRDKILKKRRQKYNKDKKPITEKRRRYNKKYFRNKYKNDPQFNIKIRLYNNFRNMVGSYIIGYIRTSKNKNIDYKAIIEHLKPFPNDIENWHIDHIIPLNIFDLTDEEQLKKAWSPINFQWLGKGDNSSKRDIVDFDKYPEQKEIFNQLEL